MHIGQGAVMLGNGARLTCDVALPACGHVLVCAFQQSTSHAIASCGSLSLGGARAWRWIDRIDRAFIERYQIT